MVHLLGKIFQWFLKNFNRVLLYDPAILLPEVYPKELKTGTQINTGPCVFIAVLFTITKSCNNPNVLLHKRTTYIHTMKYYSAIKRSEILTMLQL